MSKQLRYVVNNQENLPDAVKLIAQITVNKPLEIIIAPLTKKRTRDQNSYQWAAMLQDFAEQAELGTRHFSAATWHEYLKEKFLPEHFTEGKTLKDYVKWLDMPGGYLKMIGSTTALTTSGFSDYLEQCFALGCDLGVKFSTNRYE